MGTSVEKIWPTRASRTWGRVVGTAGLSVLLTACFDGDGGSSSSTPAGGTTVLPGGDFIETNTVSAQTVNGQVLVPGGQESQFVALQIPQAEHTNRVLAALRYLVPEAHAQNDETFVSVQPTKLELLRYNATLGAYEVVAGANSEDNASAFSLSSDGYTVDLQVLVNAGVLDAAALDTALLLRATLTPVAGGDPVLLSVPMVESEGLEISPLTEFLSRVLVDAGETGFANVSISELRNLLDQVSTATISDAANRTIEELVAALNEQIGGQVVQQFTTYQEPQPEASAVAAASQALNVLQLGSLFIGSHMGAPSFGEYAYWLDRYSLGVSLDANGRGTATFNADASLYRDSEIGQSNNGGPSVTGFFTEESLSDESFSVATQLSGSGALVLTIPGFSEFDDNFFQWEVSDIESVTLPRLNLGEAGVGQLGHTVSRYNYFDDQNGVVSEGEESAPDLAAPRFNELDATLLVAVPAAPSLSTADFGSDFGLISLGTSLATDGSARFRVSNFRLQAVAETAGSFTGVDEDSFEINRSLANGFESSESFADESFAGVSVEPTANGGFTVSVEGAAIGHGVAAPGASLIAIGFSAAQCENQDTSIVRAVDGSVACGENETPVEGELTLAVGVPLGDTALTDLHGDEYSYQIMEFHLAVGGGRALSVKSCRGSFTVSASDASTGVLNIATGEHCINLVRNGANEAALPFFESQVFEEEGDSLSITLVDGAIQVTGETEVQGFVAADGSTLLLRYASQDIDETYAAILIANRVATAE